MANFLVMQIRLGKLKLEDIPERFKAEVKALLAEQSL